MEGMETKIFNVEGMSCDHCISSIEGALNKLDGVCHSKVNLKDNLGGRVYFDGADLGNEENFNSVTSNSSYEGYIGRGKKKDFQLSVSGYDICEFEHSSTTDLEMELYN